MKSVAEELLVWNRDQGKHVKAAGRAAGKKVVPFMLWTDYCWALQAQKLPGKALHLAIGLSRLARMRQSKTVTPERKILGEFNIGERAARDGLKALETAGLVTVERHHGRLPRITLLGKRSRKP